MPSPSYLYVKLKYRGEKGQLCELVSRAKFRTLTSSAPALISERAFNATTAAAPTSDFPSVRSSVRCRPRPSPREHALPVRVSEEARACVLGHSRRFFLRASKAAFWSERGSAECIDCELDYRI